jgi:general stress protein 26
MSYLRLVSRNAHPAATDADGPQPVLLQTSDLTPRCRKEKTMSRDETFEHSLWKLIKPIRYAMLTHRVADGSLHSHPLTTQNHSLKHGEPLHFFVSRKTELGQRLRSDGNVCVTYGDLKEDVWVSISGQARISEDLEAKRRLFNALERAWFPGGPADPDLELVEVDIKHAEYWNIQESKTRQLLRIASAAVSGEPPKIGEHRELDVS